MWTTLQSKIALTITTITVSLVAATSAGSSSSYTQEIVVSAINAPLSLLAGRWVEDRSGRPIGRVKSVDLDRRGKARVVNIEVGAVRERGTQIVAVDAHHIVYYPRPAKLVASMDPPPVNAPSLGPNAPERAALKRSKPRPPIFQD